MSGSEEPGSGVILEVAPLRIRPGQAASFEASFRRAEAIISAVPGYISHELQRCVHYEPVS
jgi:heme-degrading monooxygenase HmoA